VIWSANFAFPAQGNVRETSRSRLRKF